MEVRCAGVPRRHAVRARVLDVEVGRGGGGFEQHRLGGLASAERLQITFRNHFEELQLFRIAAQRPGQPARPGAERRVALLRTGAAIRAVVDVEDALLRRAAPQVVSVAALPIVNAVGGGGRGVVKEPLQQRNLFVPLAHQRVAQLVRNRQRAQRAHCVDEKGVRPVERVDVAFAAGQLRPAGRLHRAGNLQGEFVKMLFVLVERNLPLAHQAQQIAVGGQVVEPVVVHADGRDLRGHPLHRFAPADLQETFVGRGVELQNGRAVLKSLRPLRPAARGVSAPHGEDRRPALGLPRIAARGQLVSQPQSHGQQYNRNCQAGDRCTPVSALFGVGHRPERPELVEVKHPGAAARYYHFSTENDGGDPPPWLFRWLPGAPGCTRSVIARPIVSQQTMK